MPTQRAAAQRDTPREEAERLVQIDTDSDEAGDEYSEVTAFGVIVASGGVDALDWDVAAMGEDLRRAVQRWLEARES
jgi:hypothetical protein